MRYAASSPGEKVIRGPLHSWMSPENPIVVAVVAGSIFVTAAAELVTSVPGPGQPTFFVIMMALGTLAGAAWHVLTTRSREGLQERAFIFSVVGGGIGLTVYLMLLAATLF